MKCAYCGANLQIEDEKCPHCGRDNPHYIKHRSDMQAYQADYRNTKQEVLENASRLNQRTVRITVIAILVALCAVAAVFCFLGDDIQDAREEKEIARNKAAYEAQIMAYMDAVDPVGLYEYGRRNRLTYSDTFDEYYKVFSVSTYYHYFYEYTMELMTEGIHEKYETLDDKCESLARYVGSIYEGKEKQTYDKDQYYTADKVAYMNAVAEKTELMLKAYFGLTDEEIREVPTLSRTRLTLLLTEGYQHEK